MQVNLGGERLGSGNKMNTELRNYSRSTHNLSEKFTSSLAPGVLYPFLCKLALNGDTFDIDLDAALCTIPTQGPLFGSFKMQCDIFTIPIRLYSGILHNNPIDIGLKMNQVFLPKMRIEHAQGNAVTNDTQFHPSSLIKYLGLSGIGVPHSTMTSGIYYRDVNAVPALGYFDIFKVYYSNKMESNAYCIVPSEVDNTIVEITSIRQADWYDNGRVRGITDAVWRYDDGEDIYYAERNDNKGCLLIDLNTVIPEGAIEISSNYRFVERRWNTYYFEVRGSLEFEEIEIKLNSAKISYKATPKLQTFPLKNIDNMRNYLLSHNQLGEQIIIDKNYGELPYITLVKRTSEPANRASNNCYPMNGLCIKTYQSDMFNSFLRTEYIDGTNGIAELTAIDVSDGKLKLDALLLQQKMYNVLNRIAAKGNTYEDWQEAVYSQRTIRKAETPMYVAGLSKEIVFQQIVQTAATENSDPLGTLGGKGVFTDKHKGGHAIIHINEPSFIMGIVSITPRIHYSQGNEFYMTDINTIDDLHKPELDGIGFQDLIGERMAWFDTTIMTDGKPSRNSYGKLPAWIDYMTSVDKVYGDFAYQEGKSYMVLSRNYEFNRTPQGFGHIADFTTYIDPAKYNYAFAYSDMTAQNFWVQIESHITARRIMSAKIIPNL